MADSTPSQQLWSQFTQVIADELGNDSSDGAVQVLLAAQLLADTGKTGIAEDIRNFVATIPEWGSTYSPSASRVVQAYQVVLTQAKETATNGKSFEAKYEKEKKKLDSMMGQASNFKTSKIQAWVDVKQEYSEAGLQAPSFEDWFKDNGQQEYDTMLAEQNKQVKTVQTLLSAEGVASPLEEALANLNDALGKYSAELIPPIVQNPTAQLLANWADHPTNATSITFEQTTAAYDYSKTVWKKQSGTKLFGFISIGHHEEQGTDISQNMTKSTYKMEVDFDATASIQIALGSWFDDSILREYKGGPWVQGSQFKQGNASPYGENGIFPLLITRLYVVMNPTVTITLDTSTFDGVYNELHDKMGKGINLGPFAFGGSKSDTTSLSKNEHSSQSTESFTAKDTSNIPQIIAVVNSVMP